MAAGYNDAWGLRELAAAFSMWAVMMAGMMLPTALPVTVAFAGAKRNRVERPLIPVWGFMGGYLAAWVYFSGLAALAQWGLQAASLLSPATLALRPALGGGLLAAAGLFQWSPWKDACLLHCRSPVGFFLAHWRSGPWGALEMGLRYGIYCVGCCWALMLLSFALGIMNVSWMALLTVFMLAEKAAPGGRWITRIAGVGLVAWGAAVLWRSLI